MLLAMPVEPCRRMPENDFWASDFEGAVVAEASNDSDVRQCEAVMFMFGMPE